jgi:hypothetical protein
LTWNVDGFLVDRVVNFQEFLLKMFSVISVVESLKLIDKRCAVIGKDFETICLVEFVLDLKDSEGQIHIDDCDPCGWSDEVQKTFKGVAHQTIAFEVWLAGTHQNTLL